MMVWYPEFYCLVVMISLLVGLMLWNKFGNQLIQFFSAGKRR